MRCGERIVGSVSAQASLIPLGPPESLDQRVNEVLGAAGEALNLCNDGHRHLRGPVPPATDGAFVVAGQGRDLAAAESESLGEHAQGFGLDVGEVGRSRA